MADRWRTTAVATGVGFLLVTALVVTGWDPLDRLDAQIATALNGVAGGSPSYTSWFQLLTVVFQPWHLSLAVVAVAVVLVVAGEVRRAAWLVVVGGVGAFAAWALKRLLRRDRPVVPAEVSDAIGFAFPSQHALHATLGAALLVVAVWPYAGRIGRRVALGLAVGLAVLVSYSRIALGVHYLSDIVAGMLLSVCLVATGLGVAGDLALRHRCDPASRPPPLGHGSSAWPAALRTAAALPLDASTPADRDEMLRRSNERPHGPLTRRHGGSMNVDGP